MSDMTSSWVTGETDGCQCHECRHVFTFRGLVGESPFCPKCGGCDILKNSEAVRPLSSRPEDRGLYIATSYDEFFYSVQCEVKDGRVIVPAFEGECANDND